MIRDQFVEIYNKKKLVRDLLKNTLNEVLPTVDFSNTAKYRYNKIKGGIEINLSGCWVWSWMNTLNTNYSCLYLLIDEINRIEPKKILGDYLENNTEITIEYFKSCLIKHKQVFFTRGSNIFRDMFFITQMTWNKGLISVISGLITFSKHFEIENFNVDYKRGQIDDMTKGCDLEIFFDGRKNKCQHKISKLYDKGGFFISNNFIYSEEIYRKHVDLISIESDEKIYLFHNSKDKNLCGTDERGNFKIYKSILIHPPMYKENQEVTKFLTMLNQHCFTKKIIFEFEKGDVLENYFEDVTNNNVRIIKLFLNNFYDDNLVEKIKNQIDKL